MDEFSTIAAIFARSTRNTTRLQKGDVEGEVGGVGRLILGVSKLQTIVELVVRHS